MPADCVPPAAGRSGRPGCPAAAPERWSDWPGTAARDLEVTAQGRLVLSALMKCSHFSVVGANDADFHSGSVISSRLKFETQLAATLMWKIPLM